MLSRVVVPSVYFTPCSGVRIPLTTAPASLPCTPLFVAMRHLPPTGGKSLLAGGGQLSCNSRTGQIKNALAHCSGSNHGRHSYRMGPATTTTAASGRCREELLGQRPARRKCRPRHARMLGAATRGTKQQSTGALVAVLRTAVLSRVVVPSVCFTPWRGVRIPLTTAPASLPCFRR